MSDRLRIVQWNGEQIKAKVLRASEAGVNETTADAARSTRAPRRKGQLQSEVVSEPAERSGDRITGKFGSTKGRGFYGLILERRSPFLRPASDTTFPKLARNIAQKLGA
jgi:hypothetical protein